jgi:hypothetical protein
MSTGVFGGRWSINKDTIAAVLDDYWFEKESSVSINDYKDFNKTHISVSLLRPEKKDTGDTLRVSWLLSINN